MDPVGFTEPALLLFLSPDFPSESPWDSLGMSGTAHLMTDNHLRISSILLELNTIEAIQDGINGVDDPLGRPRLLSARLWRRDDRV